MWSLVALGRRSDVAFQPVLSCPKMFIINVFLYSFPLIDPLYALWTIGLHRKDQRDVWQYMKGWDSTWCIWEFVSNSNTTQYPTDRPTASLHFGAEPIRTGVTLTTSSNVRQIIFPVFPPTHQCTFNVQGRQNTTENKSLCRKSLHSFARCSMTQYPKWVLRDVFSLLFFFLFSMSLNDCVSFFFFFSFQSADGSTVIVSWHYRKK